MRKLTVGLTILAAATTGGALTGCASSASTSTSPSTGSSASATTGASASAAAKAALGGGSAGGLAQWVVQGTFQTEGKPARPLSGTVTFRDGSTGKSVSVSVGTSGQFTLGLVAGTYTATPEVKGGGSPCASPVTVSVRAGQQAKVTLACSATA
jgi:hypothetical protein